MRNRRFVIGVVLVGLILGVGAVPASAVLGVPTPPTPTVAGTEALAKSLVPARPTVIVPSVPNPDNPQLPLLPIVVVPPGARPALGVLSPTTVLTCQASYLGPLASIVALAKVMDTLGQHPVSPAFLSPAFSPVLTVCTAAPYPTVSHCGPDTTISDALANHPDVPALPGGLPTLDPFASIPAPFASAVVMVGALNDAVEYYVYNDTVTINVAKKVETQLECD